MTRTMIGVGLFLGMLLSHAQAAIGHTLEVPNVVQGTSSGAFSVTASFNAQPAAKVASYGWRALGNVQPAGAVSDCVCPRGCNWSSGQSHPIEATGSLQNASQNGRIAFDVQLCGGELFSREVVVAARATSVPASTPRSAVLLVLGLLGVGTVGVFVRRVRTRGSV